MTDKELLTLARAHFAAGHSRFICTALRLTAQAYDTNACRLIEQIEGNLAYYFTLTTYVKQTYGQALTDDQAYLARLAWIDKMLEAL